MLSLRLLERFSGSFRGVRSASDLKLSPAQESLIASQTPTFLFSSVATGRTTVAIRRADRLSENATTTSLCSSEQNVMNLKSLTKREKLQIQTVSGSAQALLLRKHSNMHGNDPLTFASEADLLRAYLSESSFPSWNAKGSEAAFVRAILSSFYRLDEAGLSLTEYRKEKSGSVTKGKVGTVSPVELSDMLEGFRELKWEKRRLNRLDYVRLATQLLSSSEASSVTAAMSFGHLVVDDIQDLSPVHIPYLIELLKLHKKDFLVCGDDDQITLGFLGAGVSSFRALMQAFPDVPVHTLSENYRNVPGIADSARRLIVRNKDRLETHNRIFKTATSVVHEKTVDGDAPVPVSHLHFASAQDEIQYIVDFIETEHPDKNCAGVAVLARVHKDAVRLVEALRKRNIAVNYQGGDYLLARTESVLILAYLTLLNDPAALSSDEVFRTIAADLYGIAEPELAVIVEKRQLTQSLYRCLESLVAAKDPSLSENAGQFVNNTQSYLCMIESRALADWLPVFVQTVASSLAAKERTETSDSLPSSLVVDHLISYLDTSRKSGDCSDLKSLLEYLKRLEMFGDDVLLEAVVQPNAVSVMTIHRSQGLEFDTVFLMSAADRKIPGMYRSTPNTFVSPTSVPHALPSLDSFLESERRLVYEAVTRAKHRFIFTTCQRLKPSRYIAETLGYASTIVPIITPTVASSPAAVTSSTAAALDDAIKEGESVHPQLVQEPAATDIHLKIVNAPEFYLSHSRIDSYLQCPTQFYYRYIMLMPSVSNVYMVRGKALHAALEHYGRCQMRGRPTPTLEEMETVYNKEFDADTSSPKRQSPDYLTRREAGLETLREWYSRSLNVIAPSSPLKVEEKFEVEVAGIKIVGVWDRVDKTADGQIVIIDYKSGITGKVPERRVRDSLQLSLYALAYEKLYKVRPSIVAIESIDSGHRLGYPPTDVDLQKAADTVEAVKKNIFDGKFVATPSVSTCRFCSFHKICPASMWRTPS